MFLKNVLRVLVSAVAVVALAVLVLATGSCENKIKYTDLVFRNVNLISMTGEEVTPNCSVYVAGGKIRAVGKLEELNAPASVTMIDASGKYLVPGLVDAHVHFSYPEEAALFIANGVTLARNMDGHPPHLEYRERIRRKELLGPELYTTGPIIDGPNQKGHLVLDDPAKVPAAIKKMKDDGYDAIKVFDGVAPDVYAAMLSTAQGLNLPVYGHVPNAVGLEPAILAGQQSIEHLLGYVYEDPPVDVNADLVELTVQSDVWNCPTLLAIKNTWEKETLTETGLPELKYVPADKIKSWKAQTGMMRDPGIAKNLLKDLSDHDARIVAGTDSGWLYEVAGFSLHEELELMQEAGLTPYQILVTTTVNPARMLGLENRLGTIEPGKDADLVLLDKNPLEEVRNTRAISGVMAKGTWLPKQKLDQLLDDVAAKVKQ